MSVTISNGKLSARMVNMGAELKGLCDLATGQEYIWQSDPAHWTGAAPILFPIIGGLKDNQYTFEGKTYSTPWRSRPPARRSRSPRPPKPARCTRSTGA